TYLKAGLGAAVAGGLTAAALAVLAGCSGRGGGGSAVDRGPRAPPPPARPRLGPPQAGLRPRAGLPPAGAARLATGLSGRGSGWWPGAPVALAGCGGVPGPPPGRGWPGVM